MEQNKKSASVKMALVYATLILLTFLCLFFFYILIINATRSHADLQKGFSFLPGPHFVENIKKVANDGTSDQSVAEEAALTAEFLGNSVTRLYDVGVSGIHRLLTHSRELMGASVVIAIAGMEGALASVVGGLCDCPVIAVPTSVGYGAAFGGLAALLSMLNSCASGVSVVNIDNGFGAGYLASMINHMEARK